MTHERAPLPTGTITDSRSVVVDLLLLGDASFSTDWTNKRSGSLHGRLLNTSNMRGQELGFAPPFVMRVPLLLVNLSVAQLRQPHGDGRLRPQSIQAVAKWPWLHLSMHRRFAQSNTPKRLVGATKRLALRRLATHVVVCWRWDYRRIASLYQSRRSALSKSCYDPHRAALVSTPAGPGTA